MNQEDAEYHSVSELLVTRHHPAEIFYGVAALVFAVFLLTQLGEQTKYFPGMPVSKQPGLWSAISVGGMVLFGILEVWRYWTRNDSLDRKALWPELLSWVRALEFCVWFMVYVGAVPFIGYLPSTLVFCVLLAIRLGYRSRKLLISAVMVAIGTVVVFKSLLQVKIPGGVLYEYLPDGIRSFVILNF